MSDQSEPRFYFGEDFLLGGIALWDRKTGERAIASGDLSPQNFADLLNRVADEATLCPPDSTK